MTTKPIPHMIFLTYHPPDYYIAECVACFWRVSGKHENVTQKATDHKKAHNE